MFSYFMVKQLRWPANLFSILFLGLLLGACTSTVSKPDVQPDAVASQQKPKETSRIEKRSTQSNSESKYIKPNRPEIDLTQDILFKILLAEVAGQRGKLSIALENYVELAYATRDPLIVERATRIAIYGRNDAAAFETAQLWLELEPESPDANQVMVVMSLRQGNIDQSLKHLEVILKNVKGQFDQKIWMIANFLGNEEDKTIVISLMERLMAKHMDDANAIYAFATVAARMGDTDRAKSLLERVLEIKPKNEAAVLNYLLILKKENKSKVAISWLEAEFKDDQMSFSVRIEYARLLAETKQFEAARRQFETLAEKDLTNANVLYALGLLYLQDNKLDKGEEQFKKLTKLKQRVSDSNYYLGRIAEQRNEIKHASTLYQGVHEGENHFDARIRLSLILAKQGEIDKALTSIREIKNVQGTNRLILVQAEAEILIGEKRYQEAMAVFDQAINEKSHPELLYARAMLSEKMDRLDVLEADLKAILAEDANNVTALNALGYTLADRTDRYAEAYSHIKQAYDLSSGDFYILDSMGWVLYRMGRLDEAIDYLRRAFKLRNDPEIAAHLSEVLWVKGNRQAAQKIWEMALKGAPADIRLLEVIKRFKP